MNETKKRNNGVLSQATATFPPKKIEMNVPIHLSPSSVLLRLGGHHHEVEREQEREGGLRRVQPEEDLRAVAGQAGGAHTRGGGVGHLISRVNCGKNSKN